MHQPATDFAPALVARSDRADVRAARHSGDLIQPVAGASPSPLVSVRDVTKTFGDFTAVRDVTFDLAAGQFLTILGPSGCGKTTLLRLLAGFAAPSSGSIVLAGRPIEAVPPHRRPVGMVFQKLALFPHMTVEQNVAFPLRMRRFPVTDIPARVATYLDIVHLGGFGKRRIGELSGGQQQRVAIARALVFQPELLLLDEPLAALDKKLREDMQLEFRRIQKELGVTTINVTHDQREALVMSDNILVMHDGRVQQFASPGMTYSSPSNRFVADFIGLTNFLPATVVPDRDGSASVRYRVGSEVLSAREPVGGTGLAAGRSVDCGIRAERILIGDAARSAEAVFACTVDEAIFEGERVIYIVTAPSLADASLRVIHHHADPQSTLAPGQPTFVGWERRDLVVFPS